MAAPTVAWAALDAYETAQLALDKPLIAANAIPISPTAAKWNDAGTVADADLTLSTHPIRRAYDGKPGLVTKTDGSAASTWYMVFDLQSAGIEFDGVAIMGHNFGTLSLTTVTLEVADSADFATNLREVADFGSPSDDSRLIVLDPHHTGSVALRYSDVQYARLKLSKGSNFTPELGELVFLRRRQLQFKPDRPFDEYAMSEDAEFTHSANGIIDKTIYSRRGFELSGEFKIDSDTYRDDLVAFYRACRGPFIWIDNPSSAPEAYHLMVRDGPFAMPRAVANRRDFRLAATEQGPESFFLDVEVNG